MSDLNGICFVFVASVYFVFSLSVDFNGSIYTSFGLSQRRSECHSESRSESIFFYSNFENYEEEKICSMDCTVVSFISHSVFQYRFIYLYLFICRELKMITSISTR